MPSIPARLSESAADVRLTASVVLIIVAARRAKRVYDFMYILQLLVVAFVFCFVNHLQFSVAFITNFRAFLMMIPRHLDFNVEHVGAKLSLFLNNFSISVLDLVICYKNKDCFL